MAEALEPGSLLVARGLGLGVVVESVEIEGERFVHWRSPTRGTLRFPASNIEQVFRPLVAPAVAHALLERVREAPAWTGDWASTSAYATRSIQEDSLARQAQSYGALLALTQRKRLSFGELKLMFTLADSLIGELARSLEVEQASLVSSLEAFHQTRDPVEPVPNPVWALLQPDRTVPWTPQDAADAPGLTTCGTFSAGGHLRLGGALLAQWPALHPHCAEVEVIPGRWHVYAVQPETVAAGRRVGHAFVRHQVAVLGGRPEAAAVKPWGLLAVAEGADPDPAAAQTPYAELITETRVFAILDRELIGAPEVSENLQWSLRDLDAGVFPWGAAGRSVDPSAEVWVDRSALPTRILIVLETD